MYTGKGFGLNMIKSQETKQNSDKIEEKLMTAGKSKPVITVTRGSGQID